MLEFTGMKLLCKVVKHFLLISGLSPADTGQPAGGTVWRTALWVSLVQEMMRDAWGNDISLTPGSGYDEDAQGNGLAGPCQQDPLLILVGRIPPFTHGLTTPCLGAGTLSRSRRAWVSYRLSHSPSPTWSRRRQLMGSCLVNCKASFAVSFWEVPFVFLSELPEAIPCLSPAR